MNEHMNKSVNHEWMTNLTSEEMNEWKSFKEWIIEQGAHPKNFKPVGNFQQDYQQPS